MDELTIRQAEALLRAWAAKYKDRDKERDECIIVAHKSGLGPTRTARLMGIGRTTVDRVLEKAPGEGQDGPAGG